jgi:hypothetical protein
MFRRFPCLGALLLLALLSVPACDSDNKAKNKGPTVIDPDAGEQPKPAARGG